MPADRGQAGVHVDVAGLLRVRGEKRSHQRGDQLLPVLRIGCRGPRRRVGARAPAAAAENRRPRVGRSAAAVECGEERIVAEQAALSVGVDEQLVGVVHRRQRGIGVQRPHLPQVAAEDRLFQRGRAEQVVGQPQQLPVVQHRVVLGDDGLQLWDRSRCRFVAEQCVQHRHEVTLAGAEGSRQERPTADPGAHRLLDDREGLIECGGKGVRDDVIAHRRGDSVVADPVGQAQHVVLGARLLRDVDDLAQQHAAGPVTAHPMPLLAALMKTTAAHSSHWITLSQAPVD